MFNESGAVTRFPSIVPVERPQADLPRDARAAPGEIFIMLWRRRMWIMLGMLAGSVAAAAFLATATPRYTAVAQLLIDPNDLRVIDNAVTSSSAPSDANTAHVESQVRVLTSDTVLRKVIEAKSLDRDPEFVQPASAFRLARELVSGKLGLATPAEPRDPVVTALQGLAQQVIARRQERTYVVDLSVTTRQAEKSAGLANAIR